MNICIFNNITVMGRVAYAIMCFEKYVTSKYTDVNFSPVAEMMWSIIDGSNYLDESCYKYIEIVPECLFEFNSYEESDFDYLTKEEYNLFTIILNASDLDLNTIMKSIYDIAMAYVYTPPEAGALAATLPLKSIIDVLTANGIDLPDVNAVAKYNEAGSDGLGDCFDGRYLSIILK